MKYDFFQLVRLAIPVILAQLALLTMQLVDLYFVGRINPEAIGGVSIGNAVFSTLLVFGIGILSGLDFQISKSFGEGRIEEGNRQLVQGLYVATAFSLPFMAVSILLAPHFEKLGIAPGIAKEAEAYLPIISLTLWPSLLFATLQKYLQAVGIATPVTLIVLLANGVNAWANWEWVPLYGVAGSAWATFAARVFIVAALAIYLLIREHRHRPGLFSTPLAPSSSRLRMLAALGIPAGLQMLLEVGVFATSTMLAGRLGAIELAAHQIVLQIASFTFMIPLGLSSAAAVLVARGLGERLPARSRRTGWLALVSGGSLMTSMGFAIYLLSQPLLRIFSEDPEVLRVGGGLLLFVAFFQIWDSLQVVGTGVLRGLGNTRISMATNLLGHWCIGLPTGTALCFWAEWGIRGIWLGLTIGLGCVAVTLVFAWNRLSRRVTS